MSIVQQRLTEFPTYAFPLCLWSYCHLRQLMAVSFRMGFERTAAYNMSCRLVLTIGFIGSQEYLTTSSNDAVIDMRKGIQVGLFQPEIRLYPLFVQSDKVVLIAWFVSDNSYHYQMT